MSPDNDSTGGDVGPRSPLTIDDGLPPSAENWPAGVLDSINTFAQGDVIDNPPLFYFADPSRPVWARTSAYSRDSEGPEVVECGQETRPRYGVITTQTCDIGEEDAERPVRPWVQLSPVYERSDLDGGVRSLLRRGKGPRYLLHLPALPDGFWVADLRIEVPVEKGWLAGRSRVDGFASEDGQRQVGERVGLLRRRPAFARSFVRAVQRPLVDSLRHLKSAQRELYDEMEGAIYEVAVALDSHLDPTTARLTLLLDEPLSQDALDWWGEWWDRTVLDAADLGFTVQGLDFRASDSITVREYRDLVALPLARISPD